MTAGDEGVRRKNGFFRTPSQKVTKPCITRLYQTRR